MNLESGKCYKDRNNEKLYEHCMYDDERLGNRESTGNGKRHEGNVAFITL